MSPLVDQITVVLRDHPYIMGQQRCFCGSQCWADTHREHVAEQIAEAIAGMQLPSRTRRDCWG